MSARKQTIPAKAAATGGAPGSNGTGAGPESAHAPSLLDQVRHLLDLGKAQEAFDLINARGGSAPAMKNIRGVCLMRMQQPALAVRTYRSIVLDSSGIGLRTDVPTVFKTNFATALLLDNNISGCQSVLDEIRDESHPAVQKLRAVIARWAAGLSFIQRLAWKAGSQPKRPLIIDFVPGDLT